MLKQGPKRMDESLRAVKAYCGLVEGTLMGCMHNNWNNLTFPRKDWLAFVFI